MFQSADIILQVRGYGANREQGGADLDLLRKGQVVVAAFEPLTAADEVKATAEKGATLFALELVPRITRAQSMDILSSMATIAGYKAVIIASDHLPKMFPMMMTAAGTIKPAKVLVIGGGVTGISVGRELSSSGYPVTIIERKKEPGGPVEAGNLRCRTTVRKVRGQAGNFQVELQDENGGRSGESVDVGTIILATAVILVIRFIPEPGLLLLLGSGVAGLVLLGRRRMRQ
mgnify:CR=1 FL=1